MSLKEVGRFLVMYVLAVCTVLPIGAYLMKHQQRNAEVFHASYSCMEPAEMTDVGEVPVWSFESNIDGQALFYISPLDRGTFTLLRGSPFAVLGEVSVEESGIIFENKEMKLGLQGVVPSITKVYETGDVP